MSDVVLVALISAVGSAVISVGVVALNLFYNYRSAAAERAARAAEREEDRREWYRRTLFKKRLTAVREAYEYLAKLQLAIFQVDQSGSVQEGSNEMTSEGEHLFGVGSSAWDWYNKTALYLSDAAPWGSTFSTLALAALIHARGGKPRDGKDIWQSFREADAEIKARAEELMGREGAS